MKINLLKSYNHFISLVWIFFTIIMWLLYMHSTSAAEGGLLAVSIIACAYPFTTYLSRNLLRRAIKRKEMLLFAGQFFLITAIIALFIPFILYGFLLLEKAKVFTTSNLIIHENSFLYEYLNAFLVTLLVNFGFCGLRFYEINLKLQKELVDSKLDVLQGQITPHFMFNVLNHIHVLMESNVELASCLLIKYSEILRYQLYNAKIESIPLDQEVDFLNNFIEVEKIRWENNLEINCSWEIEDKTRKIAPLLLITFIENAFKHVPRDDFEKGVINIDLCQKGSIIQLEVQNSKSTVIGQKSKSSGLGLINTKRRLDILYSGKYKLSIKETEKTYHIKLILNIA